MLSEGIEEEEIRELKVSAGMGQRLEIEREEEERERQIKELEEELSVIGHEIGNAHIVDKQRLHNVLMKDGRRMWMAAKAKIGGVYHFLMPPPHGMVVTKWGEGEWAYTENRMEGKDGRLFQTNVRDICERRPAEEDFILEIGRRKGKGGGRNNVEIKKKTRRDKEKTKEGRKGDKEGRTGEEGK